MWIYEKRLEYPVNITKPDPRMAKLLMAQYGGPDSELGAGLRYLTQRFSMPDDRIRATLNDIGTEEIAHWEMIGTMIHQCMQGATCEELKAAGLDGYYVVHSHGVFPADPNGVPFTTAYIQCTGDPIADISEDMAADAAIIQEQLFTKSSSEFQWEHPWFPEYVCRRIYNQSAFPRFRGSSVPSSYNSQSVRGDYRPPQFFHRVRLTAFHRLQLHVLNGRARQKIPLTYQQSRLQKSVL